MPRISKAEAAELAKRDYNRARKAAWDRHERQTQKEHARHETALSKLDRELTKALQAAQDDYDMAYELWEKGATIL